MEALLLLFGVALVVTLLIMFIRRLFSPSRLPQRPKEPYSLSLKDSDLSYFNQANRVHAQLRNVNNQSNEFRDKLFEIIHLCQLEIRNDRSEGNHGDAQVLLANAYFLLALRYIQSKVYDYCIVRALALITRWHDVPRYTRNQRNGEKIHAGITKHVKGVESRLSRETRQTIQSIVYGGSSAIYESAIASDAVEHIKGLLATHTALELGQKADIEEDNPQKAIEIYTAILEKQPDNLTALYLRATAYHGAELYEKAIEDLDRAIALNPSDGDFYSLKGHVYYGMKRHVEALDNLNMAIRLQPELGPNYATRGLVLGELGRKDEARQSFERFLKSPDANFDGGATARQIEMMVRWDDDSFPQEVEALIKPLKALRDAGLLTEAEYNTKVVQAMLQVIVGPQA